MKWLKRILFLLVIILILIVVENYPKLNIISGYASKYMASSVLIAHHMPAMINAQDLNVPLINLATTDFIANDSEGTSNVYGLMERKAIDRQELGAVLVTEDFDQEASFLQPNRERSFDSIPYPFGHLQAKDTLFPEINYDQLNKAVALPFGNSAVQKTRTLLILYKGHLLYENYAEGFDYNTPVLGWSMTKSVLATLYGVLEHQGKLNVDDQAPILGWKNDDRKNITLNHLLRMQSGLEWDENYEKISDVTKMLFLDSDMTKAQKEKEAIAAPEEIWNYSSGTTNLLSGILRQQFKSHQEYLDFPYSDLIDKIGAHSMILEADVQGNYVGSSYGWASTRDWGRLGQLYLNEGNWNGEQLFSPSWIDYITKPTRNSNGTYGAHFWLNSEGIYPDVPKDLYSMNGYQGQYVFMIPSKDLVVVRTGLAEFPEFDINGFLSVLVSAIE